MMLIYNDPESLSRAAADLFVKQAREAVDRRGRFTVALSGGNTPLRTYQLLARPPWRDQAPWPHIHFFWSDERCVDMDDDRSNAGMARRTLLRHVPVEPARVHPIQCDQDPEAGALAYNEILQIYLPLAAPTLDLVFLGLGNNGHTASLFPYNPALEENVLWAADVFVIEEQMHRVTLTPVLINASRTVVFLVYGREKAQILKTIVEGPSDAQRLPAQLIRPRNGRLIWMVDRSAAAALGKRKIMATGNQFREHP